jgi:drug/metabolite transporter (DMT)-like permease
MYVLITAFLFGTMEVVLKQAGANFNAIQLTFIRFMIGGLILLPFAIYDLKKRRYKLTKGDWLYLLLLGVVCICISMALFQVGVMQVNANLAAIIISMNPVFTMIFAHFLVNEKFTRRKALVLALSIIGLIIVANPTKVLNEGSSISGILIILIAAIAFGLYSALGKKRIAKIGGLPQNSFSFILGSLVLLVILLVTGMPVIEGINSDNILLIIYLGIFVTGLGYYSYLRAIELVGPSTASIAFFFKPVFATITAYIVLKEAITINIVFGVLFLLSGSIINMTAKK